MLYYIILIIFFTFIVIFTRKCYKYIRFRKIDNTDNESEANKMGEIKAVNIPIKADMTCSFKKSNHFLYFLLSNK